MPRRSSQRHVKNCVRPTNGNGRRRTPRCSRRRSTGKAVSRTPSPSASKPWSSLRPGTSPRLPSRAACTRRRLRRRVSWMQPSHSPTRRSLSFGRLWCWTSKERRMRRRPKFVLSPASHPTPRTRGRGHSRASHAREMSPRSPACGPRAQPCGKRGSRMRSGSPACRVQHTGGQLCATRVGALWASLWNPAVRNADAVSAATSATIDVSRCRRSNVHCISLTSSRLLRLTVGGAANAGLRCG